MVLRVSAEDMKSLLDGPPVKAVDAENPPEMPKQRRSTVLKRRAANTYRRAFSETQLLDLVNPATDFEDGNSLHFITGGDVDALSYLKLILRAQPLEYCLCSTWCLASEDVFQMRDWLEAGQIKRLDVYVGEIFPGTYKVEHALLVPIIRAHGGRVAVFRNHSKVWAGYGPRFAFGIETSANINTNPRTENGVITIGQDIYDFYREYFDGIISFDKDDREVQSHG